MPTAPRPSAEPIAAMRDALRRRRLAAGTVRNVLNALGAMFTWARKRGLVQVNPCRDVEKPAADLSLDFLTRAEVDRLLTAAAAASPLQHVVVALALHTGLRKGELFGLRWDASRFQRYDGTLGYRWSPQSLEPRRGWTNSCNASSTTSRDCASDRGMTSEPSRCGADGDRADSLAPGFRIGIVSPEYVGRLFAQYREPLVQDLARLHL